MKDVTKFEETMFYSAVSNAIIAYWFSTFPGTTGPEWLGLLLVLGYLDYVVGLIRFRHGENGER